jgi:hypothetical protein
MHPQAAPTFTVVLVWSTHLPPGRSHTVFEPAAQVKLCGTTQCVNMHPIAHSGGLSSLLSIVDPQVERVRFTTSETVRRMNMQTAVAAIIGATQ